MRIDVDLWHNVKVEATKQNKALQDYVTEALQEKLNKLLLKQKGNSNGQTT
jgi:predicted HicB family RNase H-like nuclease